MAQESIQVTVGFRLSAGDNVTTPKGVQTLRLILGETPHSTYYVSTDPGERFIRILFVSNAAYMHAQRMVLRRWLWPELDCYNSTHQPHVP